MLRKVHSCTPNIEPLPLAAFSSTIMRRKNKMHKQQAVRVAIPQGPGFITEHAEEVHVSKLETVHSPGSSTKHSFLSFSFHSPIHITCIQT